MLYAYSHTLTFVITLRKPLSWISLDSVKVTSVAWTISFGVVLWTEGGGGGGGGALVSPRTTSVVWMTIGTALQIRDDGGGGGEVSGSLSLSLPSCRLSSFSGLSMR